MRKTEKDQLKDKEQILRKFIEALSKKEVSKCNALVLKMDDPVFNHAKTCINSVQLLAGFSKEKSEYLIEIKHLKEQVKTLREDKERLNRVKGFRLIQSDKQKNDVLSVFQLLKDGLYVEANRTILKPLPFIKELVQYSSIKKIMKSIRQRKKIEEQSIYGGQDYRQLKKFLRNQFELFDNLSKQIGQYLSKIDGVSNEQEWPKPKCTHDFLFAEFKNIQLKLRVYRNKNRCLSEIVNQNPSEMPESSMVQLIKSSNDDVLKQQQRQLSIRVREIHRLFAKNSKRSLINKTTMEILSQIQEHIQKLQKTNQYLSNKLNMNNQQVNDKIVIMSLQQRVAQLEKIQQKMIDGLKTNLKHIKMLQSQYVIEDICGNDVDNSLLVFGRAVNGLILQRDEKEKQFSNMIKERDNYKNEFNKLNLLSNISEQMQSQLEMMRNSSSEETSYQELTIKIQELEIKIMSLERDKEQMAKFICSQNEEIEQLKKTLKSKQDELFEIRSQTYAQQKHMKSHIKSQMEKIKVLQFQNSQSLLSSVRSDNQSFEYKTKIIKKQSNQFLKAIREVQTPNHDNERLNRQTIQIKQLQIQNQKVKEEINALNKQNIKLKQTCGTLQKRIRKNQAQIQDMVEMLAQKDKMLEQTYNFNRELQERSDGDAYLKQVTSVIVQSILKSKSEQKKTCDDCKIMITENEQYKQVIKEMKNRVQQLHKKNLKYIQQSQQLGRQKQSLSNQKEKIKQILYNIQKQLQQSQINSKVLQGKVAKVQQANKSLRNQNQQLKSAISARSFVESQYIERPVLSGNSSTQLLNKPHLFTAKGIFQANQEKQRLFLIETLETQIGPIYQTKFLYSFDSLNKVNFHRYIDNHKHLVLIIKTLFGRLIAGYSQSQVSINGTYRGAGMLMALWSSKFFPINQGKKPITYDDYFLIYGNSQLRIKSQQDRVFSNFGIANGYFHSQKKKVEHLLDQNQREVDIETYQIYSVVFQGDCY